MVRAWMMVALVIAVVQHDLIISVTCHVFPSYYRSICIVRTISDTDVAQNRSNIGHGKLSCLYIALMFGALIESK